MVQLLWKIVWQFLKKFINIKLQYDPAAISTARYITKRTEGRDSDICTPMFMAALFTIAERWKQDKCPSDDEWINKI